jgi:hypothetical protein
MPIHSPFGPTEPSRPAIIDTTDATAPVVIATSSTVISSNASNRAASHNPSAHVSTSDITSTTEWAP